MTKAIFLNRDGTINVDKEYAHRIEDSEIIEFSIHHDDSDSYRDELSGKVDLNKLELPK